MSGFYGRSLRLHLTAFWSDIVPLPVPKIIVRCNWRRLPNAERNLLAPSALRQSRRAVMLRGINATISNYCVDWSMYERAADVHCYTGYFELRNNLNRKSNAAAAGSPSQTAPVQPPGGARLRSLLLRRLHVHRFAWSASQSVKRGSLRILEPMRDGFPLSFGNHALPRAVVENKTLFVWSARNSSHSSTVVTNDHNNLFTNASARQIS